MAKIVYFESYLNVSWDVFSKIKMISSLEFDELSFEEQETYASGAQSLLQVLEKLDLNKLLISLNDS